MVLLGSQMQLYIYINDIILYFVTFNINCCLFDHFWTSLKFSCSIRWLLVVIIIMLTTGNFIPPMLIFSCKRFKADLMDDGSKQGWNENPFPAQFSASFRNAVILSSLDQNSGKNCIGDVDFVLLPHEDITADHDDDSELIRSVDIVENCDDRSNKQPHQDYFNYEADDLLHVANTTPASDTVAFSEQTVELYTETEESLTSYLAGNAAFGATVRTAL